MNILAIETSCDETGCAIVKDGTETLSNVVASSSAMHEKWGGIVPEVAAREQLVSILPVITEALELFQKARLAKKFSQVASRGLDRDIKDIMTHVERKKLNTSKAMSRAAEQENFFASNSASVIKASVDAIAVTVGPGLIGSLLIGVEAAKTIACVCGKPIIPVNHVLAHMYANFLESSQGSSSRAKSRDNIVSFPAVSLVASGGHTEIFFMKSEKELSWLGGTIDDAAGEAFDKTARLLGFGSRGGIAIQESAKKYSTMKQNNNVTICLPRPIMNDESLNFSFSGLKTAVLREIHLLKEKQQFNDVTIHQCAFEIQEAITDVLVSKTIRAAQLHNAKSILISGGVASNERLREKFLFSMNQEPRTINFLCPPLELCTDNAACIGSCAFFRGKEENWQDITAIPDLSVEV